MTGLLCSALDSDKNLLSNRFFNQDNTFIRLDDERETIAGAEDDAKEGQDGKEEEEQEEEEEDSRMQMKKRSRDGENARSSADVIEESNESGDAERSLEANARENIINLRINKEKKNDRRLSERRFSKRRLSSTRSRQNDDDAAFGAANFTEDIDSKIEEDRKKLESSIQTKERNEVNAIQGAKEAEELTEAKEGDFSALSNEAIIEKKYVHDQHWYIPGTKPTDEARN